MIYQSQRRLLRAILSPNLICASIYAIPLEQLSIAGYTSIWLDVDNTLVGAQQRDTTLQTVNWIQQAKALGFSVFIISNNRSQNRIERIGRQLSINGIYRAMKPLPHAIRGYAKVKNIDLRRGIVVGDQLFTDIVLGNWIRSFSILVDPLDKKLSLFKTVQRELELFFLERLVGKTVITKTRKSRD